MPNRLAKETSPYLLQHADNPVDWFPWGEEAIEKAKAEDKPIFLSIGYSACHWCHVMAHESFENPEMARFLNEHFVSIKVDREEHPELDTIYMEAVQMLMRHGGWPLSVFLTPDLQPFFGGTYWPDRQRGQMPGFDQVLQAIEDAWKNRRAEAMEQAGRLTELLRESVFTDTRDRSTEKVGSYLLDAAYGALSRSFDPHYGGFGAAPKFPHAMALQLLLRRWRRENQEPLMNMVRLTLDRMAMGGMYDHLGGGFHRYSTDDQWLVPHFEKMLYDNALLAACYVEAWQATGEARYARVARETLDYVLRDMTDPDGGFFYSSEDADSEGHEGKFYVWSLAEIRQILGREQAETFASFYDVTESGNFEGRNILNRPKTIEQAAHILRRPTDGLAAELAEDRCKLYGARSQRVPPGKDDKLLVSWNGLMIDGLARAGVALDEPRYLDAATRATEFLLNNLLRDGRLVHTWRQGRGTIDGFLEDYASLANALVTMYEARFHEPWIDHAVAMADEILRRFADPEGGGFYMTGAERESVLVRKKDVLDTSIPSGGGLATTALVRLGKLCGRKDYLEAAEAAFRNAVPLMDQAPLGTAQMLLALDMYLGPTPEVVILGFGDDQGTSAVLGELRHRYIPNKVVAFRDMATLNGDRSESLAAIFDGKRPVIPGPTVYICKEFACQAPVTGTKAALAAVGTLAPTPAK